MSPPTKRRKILISVICDEITTMNTSASSLIFPTLYFNINNSIQWTSLALEEDKHIRIPLFYEKWIDLYLEHDYFQCFRIKRQSQPVLMALIMRYMDNRMRKGKAIEYPIPIEKSLLICLWYLGKGDSILSTADRFNTALQSTHDCITEIMSVLVILSNQFIRWPTKNECIKIEKCFRKISGFPGVIGAIDGCHFKAKVPVNQQDRYMQHSISMQGICLPNMTLSNISVGYPGSLHDARILKESNLHPFILQYGAHRYFYDKYHLVGDSAYPCLKWLLNPYKDCGTRTAKQKKYNTALSKARVKIENVFGCLKMRWRKLLYINVYSVQKAITIIQACCTLHNFCIGENDNWDFEIEGVEPEDPITTDENDDEGLLTREVICAAISNEK